MGRVNGAIFAASTLRCRLAIDHVGTKYCRARRGRLRTRVLAASDVPWGSLDSDANATRATRSSPYGSEHTPSIAASNFSARAAYRLASLSSDGSLSLAKSLRDWRGPRIRRILYLLRHCGLLNTGVSFCWR
jgi:hypothetical protein